MYVVTYYQDKENSKPSVFSDKLSACKRCAELITKAAYVYGVIDEFYRPFIDNIKDFTDYAELKCTIDDIFKTNEKTYPTKEGWGQGINCPNGSEIIVQMFEV